MKHYIGIDPSITGLGIAIESDGKQFTNSFGFKKDDKRHDKKSDRFVLLAENILFDIEKEVNFLDGDELVIMFEGYIMAGKGRICDMAELAGFLKCYLMNKLSLYNNVRIYEVPPTSLKEWVTGKGNASKEDMAANAFELWNKQFFDEKGKFDSNQCDAFALLQIMKFVVMDKNTFQCIPHKGKVAKGIVRFS